MWTQFGPIYILVRGTKNNNKYKGSKASNLYILWGLKLFHQFFFIYHFKLFTPFLSIALENKKVCLLSFSPFIQMPN